MEDCYRPFWNSSVHFGLFWTQSDLERHRKINSEKCLSLLGSFYGMSRGAPAPRKLKLPGNHPRLDGNCLPIFSQNFALYYTIFTKLTSFKKQFIFFLNFLDFFQFFFRSTKNFHKKAATTTAGYNQTACRLKPDCLQAKKRTACRLQPDCQQVKTRLPAG